VRNQYKIRLPILTLPPPATFCRVLLRLFCIFVLYSLFISTCEPAQSLSKTAFKSMGQLPILTLPLILAQKCGKGSEKPPLRYNPRGLMVTSRFYFNNAVILRVFLSRADIWTVRCPLFHDSNNIQDKSCMLLTISIIRTCSVFEVVTSLFFNRHKKNNVNKGLMSDPKLTGCARSCLWVLPGVYHRLQLAMARKKRIFCRKIGVRSSRRFAG